MARHHFIFWATDLSLLGGSQLMPDHYPQMISWVMLAVAASMFVYGVLPSTWPPKWWPSPASGPNPTNIAAAPEIEIWEPIWKAIVHVAEVLGDSNNERGFPDALQAMRQAAIDGRIELRGRMQLPSSADYRNSDNYSAVYTYIPADYWRLSRIAVTAAAEFWSDNYHTAPESTFSWGKHGRDEPNHYAALLVNWDGVVKLWPKKQ